MTVIPFPARTDLFSSDISNLSDVDVLKCVKNRIEYEYPNAVIPGYLVSAFDNGRTHLALALLSIAISILGDEVRLGLLPKVQRDEILELADSIRGKAARSDTPATTLLKEAGFIAAA